MEVVIKKHDEDIIKVTIACKDTTDHVKNLKKYIEMYKERIRGKCGQEIVYIELSEILYFEAVERRVFLYTVDQVVEIAEKLYELETLLPAEDFIRCSKSMIVNINKIVSLRPELNRTVSVTMCNQERLQISRRYVAAFKKVIGL